MTSSETNIWELSKENVLPLPQGRRIETLNAVLQPQSREKKLERKRALEEELAHLAVGSDSLEQWHRYLQWVEQNFPTGHGKEFRHAIEECLNKFRDDETVRNNPRWLYCWVKYASCSRSLGKFSIYDYMAKSGHCVGLASFYVQWAHDLENDASIQETGNYKRVFEVYEEGIRYHAQPKELLIHEREQFELRVARKLATEDSLQQNGDEETRKFLAPLIGMKVGGHTRAPFDRHPVRNLPGTLGALQQQQQQQPFTVLGQQCNVDFPVHVSEPHDDRLTPLAARPTEGAAAIPTEMQNKENIRSAAKWRTQKLTKASALNQRSAIPHGATDTGFAIFDDGKVQPRPSQTTSASEKTSVKDVKGKAGDSSGNAKKDPLMHPKYFGSPADSDFLSIEEVLAKRWFEKHPPATAGPTLGRPVEAPDSITCPPYVTSAHSCQSQQTVSGSKQPVRGNTDASSTVQRTYSDSQSVALKGLSLKPKTDDQPDAKTKSRVPLRPKTDVAKGVPLAVGRGMIREDALDGPSAAGLTEAGKRGSAHPASTSRPSETSAASVGNSTGEPDSKEGTSPESTVTRAMMNYAIAMFGKTLDFDELQPEVASAASHSSERLEATNAAAKLAPAFEIFDEAEENVPQKASSLNQKEFDNEDKENCMPAPSKISKFKRQTSGVLTPAADFETKPIPETGEVEDENAASGATRRLDFDHDDDIRHPICTTSFAFDPDESTVAKLGGIPISPSNRISSTPFHHQSKMQPPAPSFSSKKPNMPFAVQEHEDDAFGAESIIFSQPVVLPAPEQIDVKPKQRGQPPKGDALVLPTFAQPAPPAEQPNTCLRNVTGGRNLSTIEECSREYRSSSSSGSDGSSKRGIYSASGSRNRLPFISEQSVGVTPASSMPCGASGFNASTGHRSQTAPSGGFDCTVGVTRSMANAAISTDGDKKTPTNSDAAKRRILLDEPEASEVVAKTAGSVAHNLRRRVGSNTDDGAEEAGETEIDEDEEKTGLGFKSVITSGVNPFDPETQGRLLFRTRKDLNCYTNFHYFGGQIPRLRPGTETELGGEKYKTVKLLGEGAFARVYCCEIVDDGRIRNVCLKVQKPSCPWEFYVCEELRNRLKQNEIFTSIVEDVENAAIMTIHDGFFYSNGSILVNQYSGLGTVLGLVNKLKLAKRELSELMVIFFLLEIMNVVNAVHSSKLIHGDIKPDNLLLRRLPPTIGEDGALPSCASVDCIKLIDFGRSIDMSLFPPDTKFRGTADTSCFMCPEMVLGKEWTYQTDHYGIVATAYCLIFQNYMKFFKIGESGSKIGISKMVKRSWNKQLWSTFFDDFLNIPSCSSLPQLSSYIDRFSKYWSNAFPASTKSWNNEIAQLNKIIS